MLNPPSEGQDSQPTPSYTIHGDKKKNARSLQKASETTGRAVYMAHSNRAMVTSPSLQRLSGVETVSLISSSLLPVN